MPRHWVVNASPLIVLGKIGQLSLLSQLPEVLVIPSGVAAEVEAGPDDDPAKQWLAGAGHRHIQPGAVDPTVAAWDLGRGESEVLSWAARNPGFEVILDDLASRKCAAALSIAVRGTLGVILLAHKQRLLPELDRALDQVQKAGMHIKPDVLEALRRLA